MWIPDQEGLNQLVVLLSESLSSDNTTQQRVYTTLKNFELKPDFYRYLLFMVSKMHTQLDISIMSIALTILKNNIKRIYHELHPDVQLELKGLVNDLLIHPSAQLQQFGGNILTELAYLDENYAKSVIPHLSRLIESHVPTSQSTYFRLLEQICEDIGEFDKSPQSQDDSSAISVIYLLASLFTINQNDYKNYWCLKCMNRLIPFFHSIIFRPDLNFVNVLMKYISMMDCTTSTAIMVLSTTTEVAFHHILPVFPYFAQSLISYVINADYDIAYQSSEFWICFFEHSESEQLIAPYLSHLINNILGAMKYTQKDCLYTEFKNNYHPLNGSELNHSGDDIEDNSEEFDTCEWTLRKSSAYALDRIAQIFGAKILAHLSSINTLLNDSDWVKNESAILAIGAIAKGCQNCAAEYYDHVFPRLIQLTGHFHLLIRSITCWTLSKYYDFYNRADIKYFDQVVVKTLECFSDSSPRVQSSAISSISKLVDYCGPLLSNYNDAIASKILFCLDFYTSENLKDIYEFIGRCTRYLPQFSINSIYISKIVPCTLSRLVVNHHEYDDIHLYLLDMINQMAYSPTQVLLPYVESLFKYCIGITEQTLNQIEASTSNPSIDEPDKEFMVYSIDLIGSLAINYPDKIAELMNGSNVVHLLKIGLDMGDNQLKFTAAACIGTLSNSVFKSVLPYINEIYPSLLNIQSNDSHITAANCLWASQIIIMNLMEGSSKYFDLVIARIFNMINERLLSQNLARNVCHNFVLLTKYCHDQIIPYSSKIVEFSFPVLMKNQTLNERYEGCVCIMILLSNNPVLFKNHMMNIYNLVCSFSEIDNFLRTLFHQMVSSNRDRISRQEWDCLHSQINSLTREKLEKLFN